MVIVVSDQPSPIYAASGERNAFVEQSSRPVNALGGSNVCRHVEPAADSLPSDVPINRTDSGNRGLHNSLGRRSVRVMRKA